MALQQADFYIIEATDSEARWRFACRLTETILAQGKKIHIHLGSEQDEQLLDELLWSFKPESFIPHLNVEAPDAMSVNVHLSTGSQQPVNADVLINLAPVLPDYVGKFARLAEIASGEEAQLQILRAHYKQLKPLDIALNTHDMRKTPNRSRG